MNSEKFVLQNSLEANYLNIRLEADDRLDETAVKVIRQDCPDFLIPFRIVSVNEETDLKYRLINTVALEYAEMTLPKVLFVQLYLNLLEPFVKGKDWFLDYHNFCVDTRYVYVDKHTYQVFYLYVPVHSFRSTDQEILDFFQNVFMNIMISDDKDFQVRLFRFFGGGHVTLAGLYRLMMEEKESSASRVQPGMPQLSEPRPGPQSVFQQPVASPTGPQSMLQQPVPSPTGPQSMFQQPVASPTGPQPAFQQPVPSPTGPQSAFQQPVPSPTASQSMFRQPAEPWPVKPGEEKAGVQGRKKEKKQAQEKAPVPMPPTGAAYGEDNSDDEVVQALFGSNKKGRKEKPSAESKKAEKEQNRKRQDEKGHGGLGGLFGGKKKQKNDPAGGQGPEQGAQLIGSAPFPAGQSQVPYGNNPPAAVDYASLYGRGGFGADETEVLAEDDVAAGVPWLELIDYSQPGAPQKIELNFAKPYITIGRMSSDEKIPDVAFPGEFKRIGRQHARIERRGSDFFVIDLGSANHTMVNGQVLAPNQPYRLQDGMELAFTVSRPVRYRVHM